MRRVVYVSRSRLIGGADALDAMVRHASARNMAAGVTGMLWFDGVSFAQVLEGEHASVGETMDRIRHDPRHTDLQIVLDRAVQGRQFGRWAMTRPDEGSEGVASTAFLIGLSLHERGRAGERLHDIVVGCEV